MSESANKAVFLSYASQDAEAVARIAEAVRAVGVEVWFDKDELVGGDAWDAKIRGQIASCALFVPVISAATQARREGYFRLEWKLAAQRTHMISERQAFLMPIVIDATSDAAADVPAEFRAVQWTRLPGGETPEKFCARVKKLLGGEAVPARSDVGASLDSARDAEGRGRAAPLRIYSRRWLVPATSSVAAIVALALWQPWKKNVPPVVAPSALSAPNPSSGLSEARQLVAKIWEQLNKPELSRVELEVADDFYRRAVALDPTDAEVAAAGSQVDSWWVFHRFDDTPERREGARRKAARALQLASQGFEARLAQACYLIRARSERQVPKEPAAEAEALLRALLREKPEEPRSLHALATLQRYTGAGAEARATFERLARNPAFAAQAWNEIGWAALSAADFPLAESAANRSVAILPFWSNLSLRAWVAISWRGDVEAAKEAIERIPASMMQEDFVIGTIVWVHWYRHDGPAILRVMSGVQHDWLNSEIIDSPMAVYPAFGHELAGHPEAARVHWTAALKAVETRLSATPSSSELMQRKGWILLQLGQFAEADQVLRLASELDPAHRPVGYGLAINELLRGHWDEAITALEVGADLHQRAVMPALLRLDPHCDPLRNLPRFQALLARLDASPRFAVNDPAKPGAVPDRPSEKSAMLDDKSVAVLAFANLSDDKGSEYFSDGISDELINVLGKVSGLKVPARTSSFYFKGKNVPVPEIAEKLSVAYVIEGSVQRAGDKVKIGARLTKAADGFQMWSDSFTRDAKDVFAVEEEIAGLIAKQLSLKLGASSTAATVAVNPRAIEFYLQAKQARRISSDLAALDLAESLLNQALALEPKFVRAQAARVNLGLYRAIISGQVGAFGQRDSAEMKRLITEARKVIDLDSDSGDAHSTLAYALTMGWKLEEAVVETRRGLALSPNDAEAHPSPAVGFRVLGQMDSAMEVSKRLYELDPLSLNILIIHGHDLDTAGRFDAALSIYDRALALQPANAQVLTDKAMLLARTGRLDEALTLVHRLPKEAGVLNESSRIKRIGVLQLTGFHTEADALLPEISGNRALALFYLGRNDEALRSLDPSAVTLYVMSMFLWDSMIDPVRNDPRFVKFLATLGLTEAHARAQAWRAAHPPEKPATK